MKIAVGHKFEKNLKKRFSNNKQVEEKLSERLKLLISDPHNLELKNHKLQGEKKDYYAFSVTGDVRVIYKIDQTNKIIELYDIGTHNQAY